MADERLKMGVVGAGEFASRRHLPWLKERDDVDLVAVCRRDAEQLRVVADHFEVPERFTDYGEMLEQTDLDAVLVATPHALHYEQGKQALERGMHVLMEKPMALKASEADELVGMASERDLTLLTALNPPFWKHAHVARLAISRGKIGDLEAVSLHWTGTVDARYGKVPMPEDMPGVVKPTLYRADPVLNGGGFFIDGGAHLVSELLWVTGLQARSVSAQMDDPVWDMRASVQVMFSDRVIGEILQVGDSTCPDRRIQNLYLGSQGMLRIDGMPFCVTIARSGEDPVVIQENEMEAVAEPVDVFVDRVMGKVDTEPDTHGADVVRVLEAAYGSAREGRRIDFPFFL